MQGLQDRGIALLLGAYKQDPDSEVPRINLLKVDPCLAAAPRGRFERLLRSGSLAAEETGPDLGLPLAMRMQMLGADGSAAVARALLPEAVTRAVADTLRLPPGLRADLPWVFDTATYDSSVDGRPARAISIVKGSGFRTRSAEWNDLCEAVRRRAMPAIREFESRQPLPPRRRPQPRAWSPKGRCGTMLLLQPPRPPGHRSRSRRLLF